MGSSSFLHLWKLLSPFDTLRVIGSFLMSGATTVHTEPVEVRTAFSVPNSDNKRIAARLFYSVREADGKPSRTTERLLIVKDQRKW